MSLKILLGSFFVVIPLVSFSQIINIEALRGKRDTSGLHGTENLNLSYTKNTRELLEITNNLSIQYRKRRNTVLFLNSVDLSLANKSVLEQSTFFHLRYNYRQNKWLTYEALTQYQQDVPLRIKTRILGGIGPRFTFLDTANANLFLGALVLYEYDDELNNDTVHRNTRLSTYVSVFFKVKDNFSLTTIIYYQPRLDKFEDYRISLQSQMDLKIFNNLSFITTYSMAYDAFPVVDPAIPKLTIKWTNGLSYSF